MTTRTKSTLPASLLTAAALVAPAHAAEPLEMSKEILAVQVRKQGFPCVDPASATRDPAASKPDDAAWVLACDGVTYKVKLVPDMGAVIERMPDPSTGSKTSQP